MKALLNALSFSIAAGYVAAEAAETAGVRLPAIVTAENAVIALTVVLAALLVVGDYARKTRISLNVARVAPVTLSPRAKAHVVAPSRQAYGIRRGSEAARLATPPAVNAFRKTSRLHYERAA